MPVYDVQGPDGKVYSLQADSADAVHGAIGQMFGGATAGASTGGDKNFLAGLDGAAPDYGAQQAEQAKADTTKAGGAPNPIATGIADFANTALLNAPRALGALGDYWRGQNSANGKPVNSFGDALKEVHEVADARARLNPVASTIGTVGAIAAPVAADIYSGGLLTPVLAGTASKGLMARTGTSAAIGATTGAVNDGLKTFDASDAAKGAAIGGALGAGGNLVAEGLVNGYRGAQALNALNKPAVSNGVAREHNLLADLIHNPLDEAKASGAAYAHAKSIRDGLDLSKAEDLAKWNGHRQTLIDETLGPKDIFSNATIEDRVKELLNGRGAAASQIMLSESERNALRDAAHRSMASRLGNGTLGVAAGDQIGPLGYSLSDLPGGYLGGSALRQVSKKAKQLWDEQYRRSIAGSVNAPHGPSLPDQVFRLQKSTGFVAGESSDGWSPR
jgi:hypothetical protein